MDVLVKNPAVGAARSGSPKLEVSDLNKRFQAREILKDLTFSVRKGEFLSILGPSGCGKTTLLRLLIGLLEPDGGTIRKDGVDITRARPDRRGMGIVFQNYALFENMTVLRNVEYALAVRRETRASARETALRMIHAVGLDAYLNKKPAALSGGQQQRVALARTLALNPDIILFDEPMSALDAAMRLTMRQELKNIQAAFGTTMIYVTHDQEEAFALSDRIMILDRGAAAQMDTPQAICAAPANAYVRAFVLDTLREKVDSLARFSVPDSRREAADA